MCWWGVGGNGALFKSTSPPPSETTCRALNSHAKPSRMGGRVTDLFEIMTGVFVWTIIFHSQQYSWRFMYRNVKHEYKTEKNLLGESHLFLFQSIVCPPLRLRYAILRVLFGNRVTPSRSVVENKCRPKIPSLSRMPINRTLPTYSSARPDHSAHVKQPHIPIIIPYGDGTRGTWHSSQFDLVCLSCLH